MSVHDEFLSAGVGTTGLYCRRSCQPKLTAELAITSFNTFTIAPLPLERPARATYFTGRKTELAQLLADLQPGRVVTLTGPGGIGKSALAAEAIWQLAPDDEPPDRFPDSVIFHSFYNQPQVELAFEHLIRSYGQEPRPPLRETAQAILSQHPCLSASIKWWVYNQW